MTMLMMMMLGILHGVLCDAVVRVFIGVVFEGDLKTFLLSRRQMVGQNTKEAEDISSAGLTQMALDVAYGLQYLSELKYVHRCVNLYGIFVMSCSIHN